MSRGRWTLAMVGARRGSAAPAARPRWVLASRHVILHGVDGPLPALPDRVDPRPALIHAAACLGSYGLVPAQAISISGRPRDVR